MREKRLRLGAKFVASIIHAFFFRAEFPVYIIESQWCNPDGKPAQFTFETQKNSLVKQYIFTACFISGATNRRNFRRVEKVYPRKNFLNGFTRTEKTAQNESGGQLAPPPGGATAYYVLWV